MSFNFLKLCNSTLLIQLAFFSLVTTASAQTVEIPETRAEQISEVFDNLVLLQSYVKDVVEVRKVREAVDHESAGISAGDVRYFELVTSGGPLMDGGKFVRVQEVSDKPRISETGLYISAPFAVGGRLPLPSSELTPVQKQEMKERAEQVIKEERTLRAAEDAARRLEETRNAAEKAREELEAAQAAATRAAAAKLVADRLALAKAAEAARAERAERDAERSGRQTQREISQQRERYKKQGGVYRMPGSSR
jgi:hypothetical protein